jgi:hypothetical protein
MISDTDLPHQPDTLQQQPPLLKKKINRVSIWKVVFIVLLIVNLGFGYWVLVVTDYGQDIGLGSIFWIFLIFVLAIIDFTVVLSYIINYIIKSRPQGIAKVISYTGLIPITLALMYLGWQIYLIACKCI